MLFQNFPLAKKFMDKRGRGVSRFSVEKFFVSQCRKTSQRNLSVLFQKFPVAKKFMDKRGGGEGVSRCSVENFLSHSAENFRRGESFSVSIISGSEKVYG